MEFDELLAKLGDDDQIVNEVNPNEVSKYDDDNNDNNDNIKVISEDNRPDEIATEKVEIEIEVEGEGEGEEKRSEVKCGVVTNPDEFFEEEEEDEDNDGLISGLNRYV